MTAHKSGEEIPRFRLTDPAQMRQAARIYRRLGSAGAVAQAQRLDAVAVAGVRVVLVNHQWRMLSRQVAWPA